jgi:phospholipid/cholesterol/gamma-HCH transport system ATP-binding protein
MILFEHVTKRLGGKTVLNDLNMEVRKGETFVIVGTSGAGKSVTLKHMVRLLTPDSGRVVVDGVAVSEAKGRELENIRSRFGYLFQSGALLQWLTVGDNVGLPLREKTALSDEEIDARAKKMLELVGLKDVMDKRPDDLSGGMRKRAALARAIITQPDIILYDEPTSGLDPVTSRTIDNLIDDMRKNLGVTSVVVTHDLHSALAIGTRIGMLFEGRLVEVAAPDAFVKSRVPVVRDFLEAQYITRQGVWEKAVSP